MADFSFRLRFLMAQHTAINMPKPDWDLAHPASDVVVRLRSRKTDVEIADTRELILESSGWPSEQDALESGSRCRDALMLACARWRIGVDLGIGPPKFLLARAGIRLFEQQTGSRILNDTHGLMFYETEPKPRFASGHADFVIGTPADRFEKVFQIALQNPRHLTDRERLSFDLFNSSFFQTTPVTRLLLLMMAFESLLELEHRPPQAVRHVEELIDLTRRSSDLPPKQRDSLLGSLAWLRYESIRQMGRRFASEQLGSREYCAMSAADFFDHCYDVRSRLVHGSTPAPTDQELGVAANLEVFVSDILVGELRDMK